MCWDCLRRWRSPRRRLRFPSRSTPSSKRPAVAGCHSPDGVASATRLQFPEAGAPAERIEAFGRSLVVLVDAEDPANSLLLRKPTARISHAGGQRIQPGQSRREPRCVAWIDRLTQLKGDELAKALALSRRGGIAARRRVRAPRRAAAPDPQPVQQHGARSAGRSQPAGQSVSAGGFRQRLQEPVRRRRTSRRCWRRPTARRRRSSRALRFAPAIRTPLITCKPSPACRAEFIRSFGLKRIPPSAGTGGSAHVTRRCSRSRRIFRRARSWWWRRCCSRRNFLFHLEETANPRWRPYAAAQPALLRALGYHARTTRCSPRPDAANWIRRRDRRKAARRMLDDPKAQPGAGRVRLPVAALRPRPDGHQGSPRASRSSRPRPPLAMTEETRRFVADLVWNNRDFTELFTADYGYPNADLAAHLRRCTRRPTISNA